METSWASGGGGERSGGGEENEDGPAEAGDTDSDLPSSVTEDKGKLSSEQVNFTDSAKLQSP